MPMQAGMLAQAVARVALILAAVTALVSAQTGVPNARTMRVGVEVGITDAQFVTASAGRTIRLGPAAGSRGPVVELPLEVYVARVLAGEGEPRAADAAQQALAIAIRTFALANPGRHARDGFDLCDGTHCQVARTASTASRRATWTTAGQVLTYNGAPAELFYSASCGGFSESGAQVWPGLEYPYLPAVPDEVHADEAPWTLQLTLDEVQRALVRTGFEGRLRDVRVEERNMSGRAARIQLVGLAPGMIAGDPFRAAVGTTRLRSTAFTVERRGNTLSFTGRGYGHGVGMCVIGAGRRAGRGETAPAILARYFPGLVLTTVGGAMPSAGAATPAAISAGRPVTGRGAIVVHVPAVSPVDATAVERLTAVAHQALSTTLGVSVAPMTIRLHDTIESFRRATGQPWWVSGVVDDTMIDLVPAPLLAQRDGVEHAIRVAVAELLVAPALAGRPRWVRVGAARYFARNIEGRSTDSDQEVRCPADAELMLAVSVAAQREAEARAEACFARGYARTRDWRSVR
jgi:stage II sporulation protein D